MAVVKKLIGCLFILAAAGESSAGVCKAKTTTPMPPTIIGTPPIEIELSSSAQMNLPEKYHKFYAYTDSASSLQDARDFCSARNQKLLMFDNVDMMLKAIVYATDIMAGIEKIGKTNYLIDAELSNMGSAEYYVVTFASGTQHTIESIHVYSGSNLTAGSNILYHGILDSFTNLDIIEPKFYTGNGEANADTAIICTNNYVI